MRDDVTPQHAQECSHPGTQAVCWNVHCAACARLIVHSTRVCEKQCILFLKRHCTLPYDRSQCLCPWTLLFCGDSAAGRTCSKMADQWNPSLQWEIKVPDTPGSVGCYSLCQWLQLRKRWKIQGPGVGTGKDWCSSAQFSFRSLNFFQQRHFKDISLNIIRFNKLPDLLIKCAGQSWLPGLLLSN